MTTMPAPSTATPPVVTWVITIESPRSTRRVRIESPRSARRVYIESPGSGPRVYRVTRRSPRMAEGR